MREGVKRSLDERIGIRSRPGTVVAISAEFVIFDDMTDLRYEAACLIAVHGDDGFGRGAEPAGIRRKSVASDRFTPCGVVVTAVGGGAYLLDHDPGMNRKNAPPSHGAGSIYPNDRVGMAGCRGQKSGAGAVGRLPIAAAVSKPIIAASRNSDRHNDQEQKDDHEFSQGSGGSEGIGRRRSYKFGVLGTPVQRSHLAKIAQS